MIEKLDLLFPFIVFAYGLLMTLVLHSRFFTALAELRLPCAVNEQMQRHRGLALFCLISGGFWSLQNVWLS